MKKMIAIHMFLCFSLFLVGCTSTNNNYITSTVKDNLMTTLNIESNDLQEPNSNLHKTTLNKIEEATEIYIKFLKGDMSVNDIDINYITIPKGEPDRHYGTKYAFFDSNGDGIPELHINSARYYYILMYLNDELKIWKNLSPYPHYYALKNGAFISHRFGAAPISDEYCYFIFNFLGDEITELSFSKYDKNGDGIYDVNDEYLFDYISVSKEIWEDLTSRYLYIDSLGSEQIRNEIEWIVIFEDTE